MRMLVTGPRGFVGARIMAACPGAVPAPSLRDMTGDDIRRLIDTVQPDLIVHTAAMSDIASCEQNPAASWHANVDIPVMLARTGVRCIMFSTDQVYSACPGEGPYREDESAPGNLYALHKLDMERRVLDISPDAVMLRATWMYDMPLYGVPNRGNFLMSMLRARELAFSAAQHRAVTYVREVAGQIPAAAALPGGVYNFGSENPLGMLEVAQWLKKELDLPVELRDAGERHALWMDTSLAASRGVHFLSTLDGLRRCISDYAL